MVMIIIVIIRILIIVRIRIIIIGALVSGVSCSKPYRSDRRTGPYCYLSGFRVLGPGCVVSGLLNPRFMLPQVRFRV